MLPFSPNKIHLPNIEVLRAGAALAVCLFHFCDDNYLGSNVLQSLFRKGYYGVDVFFVISGFVIPLAMHRNGYQLGDLGRFLSKRGKRLYPAYVATLLLAVGLWVLGSFMPGFRGSSFRFEPFQFFSNLTLTTGFTGDAWYCPVFWTLAIELQYYLLIAIFFPLFVSRVLWIQMISLAAWIGAPLLIFPNNTAFMFPWASLFAMGIVSYLVWGKLLGKWSGQILFALASAVTFWQKGALSCGLGLVTIGLILFVPQVKNRSIIWLGTISYSLYLVHVPIGGRIINLSKRLPDLPSSRAGALVAAIVVSIGFAYMFHRFIERPSQRWAKRSAIKVSKSQ